MKRKSINHKKKSLGILVLLVLGSTTSYELRAQEIPQPKTEMEQTKNLDNLLLEKWEGPYGGIPAFDKMDLALLQPAIEKGMALHLKKLQQILKHRTLKIPLPQWNELENPLTGHLNIMAFGAATFLLLNSGKFRKYWLQKYQNILPKFHKTQNCSNA